MGRDHSIECDDCGLMRGGIGDLSCECDGPIDMTVLDRLCASCLCSGDGECEWCACARRFASSAHLVALLCKVYESTYRNVRAWEHGQEMLWRPGCQRPAP